MKNYLIRFKGTLIAFLIFVILLASVFLYDRNEAPDESTEKVTEQVFPNIESKEIRSIKLKDESSSFTLEKADKGDWMVVTNSGEYRADNELVNNLIKGLTEMKMKSSINERTGKLNEYGFVQSRNEFSIDTEKASYPVVIGDKSPVGSGTYIYDLGEGRIMLVDDAYLEGVVNKKAGDYRDKKLFAMNKDNVDKITMKVGDFSVELKKDNGKWNATDLTGSDAPDSGVITAILDSYSGLEVSGFVSDGFVDLKDYGLNEPVAVIGFYSGKDGEEFLFGKRKDETDFYLKVAYEKPVYAVSKNYFKILPKNMDQLTGK